MMLMMMMMMMTTFRCPSDIWHLDYTWLATCKNSSSSYIGETGRKFGLRIKKHKKEVNYFTAGTQTRASKARESSVIHKSAITDHAVEDNHVTNWDKAKMVDREAQWQTRWIKRGNLDQEDTDMHESGCRILPTQPHAGPSNFQVRSSGYHTLNFITIDLQLYKRGDHSLENVKFPDNSMTFPWRFVALLYMLTATHIMPVLLLFSVVGLGMQQCMIQNQNEMHELSKVKNGRIYAANNKQF